MLGSIISSTTVYMLVFVRMAGCIAFNPLLARRNVPAMVRVALSLLLTVLVAPGISVSHLALYGSIDLLLAVFKEVAIGFLLGSVFQLVYYMLFFAGDFMDVQFGLSMAKVFDPGSNIQMSMSGNMVSFMFILYILATDSHLDMIYLYATSFSLVPAGAAHLSNDVAVYMLSLAVTVFSLALRLAMPFAVAELVLEISMGILMKLIPQIHVFVINIQLKLFLGLLLMLLFAGPIASFIGNYTTFMLENMQGVFSALA